MKVNLNSFVTIDYTVRTNNKPHSPVTGQAEELSFVLGTGLMPPSLEEAMVGMGASEQKTIRLTPQQSFGEVDEGLIMEVPLKDFEAGVSPQVGDIFETTDEGGHPVYFVVKGLKDDIVVIDFNHPLAGQDVEFDITVKAVREATPEDTQGCHSCSCGTPHPHEH